MEQVIRDGFQLPNPSLRVALHLREHSTKVATKMQIDDTKRERVLIHTTNVLSIAFDNDDPPRRLRPQFSGGHKVINHAIEVESIRPKVANAFRYSLISSLC